MNKLCPNHNQKKVYLPSTVWKLSNLEDLTKALNVRQKIECPVCYGLRYPISHTCPLNHVICYKCYRNLKNVAKTRKCPLCRSAPIKMSKQAKLMNIALKYTNISCNYYDIGCQVLVYLKNLEQHEAHCIYKPMFCIYPGCKWTCSVWSQLHEHVIDHHPKIIIKKSASLVLKLQYLIRFTKFILMISSRFNFYFIVH